MKTILTLAALLLMTFLIGGVLTSGVASADPETAVWQADRDDEYRSDLPDIANTHLPVTISPSEEFVDKTMGIPPGDDAQIRDAGSFAVLFIDEQTPNEIRINELIDTPVIGIDGKQVARIDDLVLDRDYRLTAVVLSSGGVFGFGGREIAMRPYNLTLRWSSDGYSAFVNLTREELNDAPEFKPLASGVALPDFGGVIGLNALTPPSTPAGGKG